MQSDVHQDKNQSRQEVIDFLRQLQERDERATRISGINSWILIAASCYIGLWLVKNSSSAEILKLSTLGLSISLAVSLYTLALRPTNEFTHSKARETTLLDAESTYSLPTIAAVVILIPLPTIGSYFFHGWTPSVVFGAVLSVIATLLVLTSTLIQLFSSKVAIRAIKGDNKAINLAIGLITLGFAILHSWQVFAILKTLSSAQIEYSFHITALWWISWKFAELSSASNHSKRYIHLEEELIFGISTPEKILKKLEHTMYGPSIEEALTNFEEKIEIQHTNFRRKIEILNTEIEEINKIPKTYQHEITSRTTEALKPIEAAVNTLTDEMNAKIDYINSFKGLRNSGLNEVAKKLLEKERESIKNRLSEIKIDASNLRSRISSLTRSET